LAKLAQNRDNEKATDTDIERHIQTQTHADREREIRCTVELSDRKTYSRHLYSCRNCRQTDGRTDGQWQCVDDSTLLAAITTQPGGRRRDSRQNGGVRLHNKDPLTPQFPKPLITVGDRKVVTAD